MSNSINPHTFSSQYLQHRIKTCHFRNRHCLFATLRSVKHGATLSKEPEHGNVFQLHGGDDGWWVFDSLGIYVKPVVSRKHPDNIEVASGCSGGHGF